MKHEPNYYHEEAQHEITVDKIHYYFHSFPVILPDGTIANIQVVKA